MFRLIHAAFQAEGALDDAVVLLDLFFKLLEPILRQMQLEEMHLLRPMRKKCIMNLAITQLHQQHHLHTEKRMYYLHLPKQ